MSEQQRVVAAVLACMAILFVWQFFFAPPPPKEEPTAQRQVEDIGQPTAPSPATEVKAAPPTTANAAPAEEVHREVATDLYRAEVTNRDASLTRFELTKYEEAVWVREGNEVKQDRSREQPVSLVTAHADGEPKQARVRLDIGGKAVSVPFAAGEGLTFEGSAEGITARVELTPDPTHHAVGYKVRLANGAGAAQTVAPLVTLGLEQFGGEGSMFAPAPDQVHGLCVLGDDVERKSVRDVDEGEAYAPTESAAWAGIDRQYFLVALLPQTEGKHRCRMQAQGKTLWLDFAVAPIELAPGVSVERAFTLYAGPKRDSDMVAVSPLLKEAVNYSLWGIPLGFIARPMTLLMNLFHGWTTSWGLAIICLTFLVKLLLFPVTYRSVTSMRKMQQLKPELDKIKKLHENDKERQQLEQMKLFREKGVNPIGGCLPMLLQMPVWFALYRMLWSSVDLYHQSFLWIRDLTRPEPFPIMAICVGGLTFVQQRTTPTTMDSQQMKMMLYVMPLMFSVFLIGLPSGLVLYILVNSILTIGQQLAINRATA